MSECLSGQMCSLSVNFSKNDDGVVCACAAGVSVTAGTVLGSYMPNTSMCMCVCECNVRASADLYKHSGLLQDGTPSKIYWDSINNLLGPHK